MSSSAMYAIYKQTHPPTAVEHCLYCHFFNQHEKSLVVAGVNQLRIFRRSPDFDTGEKQVAASTSAADVAFPKMKLECVQSYQLFGNIVSMQCVQLSGSPRDALLLSFQDAKLSVVEYDQGTHDLKTLSLHYFEDDDMRNGHTQIFQLPFVRADPAGRCAAMIAYGKKVVILPFRRDSIVDDIDVAVITSSSKAPVLASYTVNARDIEEKMENIIDMQFLHGYYEPTLLILYEPLKTWTGRIAIRQDTCAMVAISLNLQQKVHPVIWSINNLPFDCLQVMAVPRPIGGVLILAVNSLLYLNQSIPPYGVALNSLVDESTAFPLKVQDSVKISLDCAQATFISSDRLVVSLKGGELYVVTMVVDGMRSVRGFNFDKAAASVLTTCICACEDGYLFLGSRLGNSLLLRYTEKLVEHVEQKKDDNAKRDSSSVSGEDTPAKKKRLDTLGDWMASNVALIEDADELEVYGSQSHASSTQITSYVFEVCDSLLNVGPCGQVSMGEPAFQSEEFSNNVDPDVELVTTSGYGKNGALSVLQRNIRPQVVTTFELPGCEDMWTVVAPVKEDVVVIIDNEDEPPATAAPSLMNQDLFPSADDPKPTGSHVVLEEKKDSENKNEEPEAAATDRGHSFLILSRPDSTMILQTGQEINELDHSGFSTQASTVFAGNIGNNKYIVQISPMGIRLLEGVEQLQHIPLDIGSPIVHASVADPYVVIMGSEGQLILLTLRTEGMTAGARLVVTKPQISQKSKVLTVCTYKDYSGMFVTHGKGGTSKPSDSKSSPIKTKAHSYVPKGEMDDEDALLYGSSEMPRMDSGTGPNVEENGDGQKSKFKQKSVNATYWLLVAKESGVLEIYSLPQFTLSYLVKNFPMGLRVLVDSIQVTSSAMGPGTSSDKQHEAMPTVKELLLVGLGHKSSRPLLLARVDEELYIYEAFAFFETQTENHLKLRFRKVAHNLIIRERKLSKLRKKAEGIDATQNSSRVTQLRYFDDVVGYSGVFICGPYPHWLFMTSRGELRTHPMGVDGAVTSFAQFHNVNCPKGFLYFNSHGELRISVLPTHLSYDSSWPVRKVPLRCTPHFLSYHVESKTYCVVTSNAETCTSIIKASGEEKEIELVERDERFIYPTMERFSIQLFSPVSWEMIPNTRIDLEDWEHITCLKNVSLSYEGARSGLKGYLALGSNYNYGEDVTSRGRIFILDVIDVVPEPGQPLTKNRIKTLYCKEQKGPVTALCQVSGYLLSCIGQKIYVWQLKNSDLVGIAFIDTQIYIHNAVAIKNLVVISDIFKSISLLRFQDDVRTLSLVSRDLRPLEVYATEFFIDNSQMGFLVSDVEKNLILYMYNPEARESIGGQRLLRKGDFYVGSNIHSFFRIRCKLCDPSMEHPLTGPLERRHISMFATLDGSFGYLLPIPEKTYRRLLMLQNVLVSHIPHTAGLNPKDYRMIRSHRKLLMNSSRNMLDGDLLWRFVNLSITEKVELAKKIGTSTDQVLEDLVEIDRATAHF